MFDLLTENINLGCIFWIVCTMTDISHECPLRHDPPIGTNRFDLVSSTLMFDLHIENFNFGDNFSILCTITWFLVTKPFHGQWCYLYCNETSDLTVGTSQLTYFSNLKLWCRHGCQWNLSLSGAFVFHKHIFIQLWFMKRKILMYMHNYNVYINNIHWNTHIHIRCT
jgi:hypothetical protein